MNEKEFSVNMTYLGLAYGKEYTPQELSVYYDFLKEFSDDVLTNAIKNIIKSSNFPPKISELVEECKKLKSKTKYDVLDFMNKKGYFAAPTEYEKAIRYLEINVIPDWFKADMKEYYKMMKQESLSHQDIKFLEI